jgi:parallel beta-helix repeat protein
MRSSRSLIIALLVAATVVLPAAPSSAAPSIEIDTIVYNPDGKDTGSNSHLNKERIVVRNVGDQTISLRGWRIRNSDGNQYRFGRLKLVADSKVVLHSGRGNDAQRHLYWDRERYVWRNKADVAKLKKANGMVVDRCRYSGGGGSTTCITDGGGGGGTVEIEPGGNIQAAIDANPAGTAFQLSGTYGLSTTIRPKSGNRFVGPATIVGAGADIGFQARTGEGATGVRFVALDVSGFATGIGCWDGMQVIGGRYHHNTRNGIGCGLEGGSVVVDRAEIDHNGSEGELAQGAAGMKFAQGHGIVVRNSFIHDNIGNGVWCDVQCGDYTVIDNRIVHNYRKGVLYEKSGESDWQEIYFKGSAYIARNVIQDNGWEGLETVNAGIMAVSSKNILIENNVFSGNNSAGIRIRQDDRLSGDKHGWVVSNVVIGANEMNGDEIQGCDLDGVTC